jgi:valyl-tRNA synthetase
MDAVITVISGIRRVRGESNIPPSRPLPLVLSQTADNATATMLQGAAGWICTLARCERVELLGDSSERPAPAATTVEGSIELIIPLEGLIDLESERARMEKELAQLDVDAAHFEKKLGNPRFVEKAPPEVLAKDRARLEEVNDARRKVQEALARLT